MMTSLQNVTVNNHKEQEPSPTICLSMPAQDQWHSNMIFSVKGSSSLTLNQHFRLRASMTLEAAIVLPIFLFFLLSLSSAIEMIRLHNQLQAALFDTGNRVALLACEQSGKPLSSLISSFYVRNCIVEFVGEEYLEESPLADGAGSLRLWESEMLSGEDELEIVLTYEVRPLALFPGVKDFRMANRYVSHLWNGYEIPQNPSEKGLVYVTQYGEAYHTNRNCTYLVLAVYRVRSETIAYERNEKGERYRPCELCSHGEMPESVYLAREGECYHRDRQCSGLKRTVIAIPEEESGGYRPCSRCSTR